MSDECLEPVGGADMLIVNAVLGLFAGIMALTALITLMIPETKGRSIDEIENGVLYGESVSSDSDGESAGQVSPSPSDQADKQMAETRKPAL